MKERDDDQFEIALELETRLQQYDARSHLRRELDRVIERAIAEHRSMQRIAENVFDVLNVQLRVEAILLEYLDAEAGHSQIECSRVDGFRIPADVVEQLDQLKKTTSLEWNGQTVTATDLEIDGTELGRLVVLFAASFEGVELRFIEHLLVEACSQIDNLLMHRLLSRFEHLTLPEAAEQAAEDTRSQQSVSTPRHGYRGQELECRIETLREKVDEAERIARFRQELDSLLETAIAARWDTTRTLEKCLDLLERYVDICSAIVEVQSDTPFATHKASRTWDAELDWPDTPRKLVAQLGSIGERSWKTESGVFLGRNFDFDGVPWGWILVGSDQQHSEELLTWVAAWVEEIDNYLGLNVLREYRDSLSAHIDELRRATKTERAGPADSKRRYPSLKELLGVSLETVRRMPLEPVTVAVLDSGVDPTHPLLDGHVRTSFCYETSTKSCVERTLSNWNDDNGHGTSVASVIRRYAPNTVIVDVQVLDARKGGSGAGILAGLEKAIELGVDAINMSVSVSDTYAEDIARLTNRAYENGILVVASRRNDDHSGPGYPAALSTPISVGASTGASPFDLDHDALGSVEFSTHGENVLVATLDAQQGAQTGSSFATPIVTSMASLLLGLKPDLRTFEIKTLLRAVADRK